MRILSKTLNIVQPKLDEGQLYANRMELLQAMKMDLRQQVEAAAEELFRRKLESGDISLRLVASPKPDLNWELAKTLELDVSDEDKPLRRKDGTPLEKSLFETV